MPVGQERRVSTAMVEMLHLQLWREVSASPEGRSAAASQQQHQETCGGPKPITDHCSEHHPSSGQWGCPSSPPGTRVGRSWMCPPAQYLLVNGVHQQRAQLSLGGQALVTGADLGTGMGTESLQEAISLPREECCSGHGVATRSNSQEPSPHAAVPAPSRTQPEPKTHPESSGHPRQPQALPGLHGAFPLGCQGDPHPQERQTQDAPPKAWGQQSLP